MKTSYNTNIITSIIVYAIIAIIIIGGGIFLLKESNKICSGNKTFSAQYNKCIPPCGPNGYNPDTDECNQCSIGLEFIDGNCQPKCGDGETRCGDECYDPDKGSCIDDKKCMNTGCQHSYTDTSGNEKCCESCVGKDTNGFPLCCPAGQIVDEKTGTCATCGEGAMCGNTCMSSKQTCCGDKIYDKQLGYSCDTHSNYCDSSSIVNGLCCANAVATQPSTRCCAKDQIVSDDGYCSTKCGTDVCFPDGGAGGKTSICSTFTDTTGKEISKCISNSCGVRPGEVANLRYLHNNLYASGANPGVPTCGDGDAQFFCSGTNDNITRLENNVQMDLDPKKCISGNCSKTMAELMGTYDVNYSTTGACTAKIDCSKYGTVKDDCESEAVKNAIANVPADAICLDINGKMTGQICPDDKACVVDTTGAVSCINGFVVRSSADPSKLPTDNINDEMSCFETSDTIKRVRSKEGLLTSEQCAAALKATSCGPGYTRAGRSDKNKLGCYRTGFFRGFEINDDDTKRCQNSLNPMTYAYYHTGSDGVGGTNHSFCEDKSTIPQNTFYCSGISEYTRRNPDFSNGSWKQCTDPNGCTSSEKFGFTGGGTVGYCGEPSGKYNKPIGNSIVPDDAPGLELSDICKSTMLDDFYTDVTSSPQVALQNKGLPVGMSDAGTSQCNANNGGGSSYSQKLVKYKGKTYACCGKPKSQDICNELMKNIGDDPKPSTQGEQCITEYGSDYTLQGPGMETISPDQTFRGYCCAKPKSKARKDSFSATKIPSGPLSNATIGPSFYNPGENTTYTKNLKAFTGGYTTELYAKNSDNFPLLSTTPIIGDTVKCKSGGDAAYRVVNINPTVIRKYPNLDIAHSWNPQAGKNSKTVDCTTAIIGPQMKTKTEPPIIQPIVGSSVVCAPGAGQAVYRLTTVTPGTIRLYPSPAIATSWDTTWGDTTLIDCSSYAKGSPMAMKT
jgi:hypothetical protein